MATLTYTVSLGDRPGGSPDCDGWTYHHVLPWRYYYLAGHTLATLAKYLIATQPALLPTYVKSKLYGALSAATAEAADGKGKKGSGLAGRYGPSHADFAAGVDYKPMDLLKLANRLHPSEGILAQIERAGAIDPYAVAALSANPKFGGFAGMNPSHRRDDPKESFERLRPYSAAATWWGLLAQLRVALESFVPTLGSVPDDRKLVVTLTADVWSVFVPTLEKLTKSHNRVPAFAPPDWDYCPMVLGRRPWNYLTAVPTDKRLGTRASKCFRLNADGGGASPVAGITATDLARHATERQMLHFVT